MIVWLRNAVLIFAVLSIVYAILYFRARARQKDKLKAEYSASSTSLTQADFVSKGLEAYNTSFRPKLLLGVYGVPIVIAGLLIYLAYS